MNYLTEAGISLIFLLPAWATTSTVQCWVSDMPDKCSTNWSKSLGCYVWDRVWSSLCRPWWPQRSSYLTPECFHQRCVPLIFKLHILKYKSQTKYHPVIGHGFDLTPQRKINSKCISHQVTQKNFFSSRGSNQGFFTLAKQCPTTSILHLFRQPQCPRRVLQYFATAGITSLAHHQFIRESTAPQHNLTIQIR